METKQPEVIIIARDWEPGQAIQVVLVRPDEIVLTGGAGSIWRRRHRRRSW